LFLYLTSKQVFDNTGGGFPGCSLLLAGLIPHDGIRTIANSTVANWAYANWTIANKTQLTRHWPTGQVPIRSMAKRTTASVKRSCKWLLSSKLRPALGPVSGTASPKCFFGKKIFGGPKCLIYGE